MNEASSFSILSSALTSNNDKSVAPGMATDVSAVVASSALEDPSGTAIWVVPLVNSGKSVEVGCSKLDRRLIKRKSKFDTLSSRLTKVEAS
jgi:hypothetical protein